MVAGRDVDQGPAGSAGQGGGDREQPVAQPFRFPASGLVGGVGEQSHPGGDLAGEGDDLAPDPVLVEPVQRQIRQARVPRVVCGSCPHNGPGPDAALPGRPTGRGWCWSRTRSTDTRQRHRTLVAHPGGAARGGR